MPDGLVRNPRAVVARAPSLTIRGCVLKPTDEQDAIRTTVFKILTGSMIFSSYGVFWIRETSITIFLKKGFALFQWVPIIFFGVSQVRRRIIPFVSHFLTRLNIKAWKRMGIRREKLE